MTRFRITFIFTILISLTLSACNAESSDSEALPTAAPTALSVVSSQEDGAEPEAGDAGNEITPLAPALVLPDESGTSVACEANTLQLVLRGPDGGEFGAISRIASDGEWLFVIADGGLYRIEEAAIERGEAPLIPTLVSGQPVTGRPVQELADIAVDAARGMVYVLDKAGHVFRYEPETDSAMIFYRAAPDQDAVDGFEPQLLAITLSGNGEVALLNTSHGELMQPAGFTNLERIGESRALTSGGDVTEAGGRFYVVQVNNTIWRISDPVGAALWQSHEGRDLTLSLKTSNHLGRDLLVAVDGLQREVIGMIPGSGQAVTRHVFAFPEMGLLRDAEFSNGRLYGIADNVLYVYPGPANNGSSGDCPTPGTFTYAAPTLYGYDPAIALRGVEGPVEEFSLPPWPRIYPGANRLYRSGIHRGLDIYKWSAIEGFGMGSPVFAAADGIVTVANPDYQGVTLEEWEAQVDDAYATGFTGTDTLFALFGQQIVIDHGGGAASVYAHLDAIEPGIEQGVRVRAGQRIGAVGVTGTLGELKPGTVSPHLHFEIWLGERYIGYGITGRETMWWWEQAFENSD